MKQSPQYTVTVNGVIINDGMGSIDSCNLGVRAWRSANAAIGLYCSSLLIDRSMGWATYTSCKTDALFFGVKS